MGRMSTRKAFVFILFSIALSAALAQGVSAQEKSGEVCLVYFTSHGCGDDCRLTDTFMDGLLSEYAGNLISITYYVDSSQDNQNVFQAYRSVYGLPQDVPMVLFGKDDYLQGIDGIYSNTESKILGFLDVNGTNCPLDSGYAAPGQVSAASLPGSAEISIAGQQNPHEVNKENDTDGQQGQNDMGIPPGNVNGSGDIFDINEPMKESILSIAVIGTVLIIVAIILIYIWEKMQEPL
jgi:hypothetical protein